MNNWREAVDPLTDISEQTKCDLLLGHMKTSTKLSSDAAHFRRLDAGDPNKRLCWLENAIERRITLDSEKENIKVKHKAIEGRYGPSSIASGPLLHQGNGGGHGVLTGQGGGGKGKGAGKSGAKGAAGPSANPAVASSTACFFCGQEGHRQADCSKRNAAGKSGGGKGKGKGKKSGEGKGHAERAVMQKKGSNGMGPCLWQFEPGGCRASAHGT